MKSIIPQLKNIGKSATLQINEASLNLERKGKKIYRFGFGQSPFPVPTLVVNELKKYANEKSYLPVEGLYRLREIVADYYVKEESLNFTSNNILIGPGSKELMYILQMVLDCTVIIPSPSWVSYEPQSIILNKKHIFLDTSYESKWKITTSTLEMKCKKIKGLKLLILNYPNNPTGLSYTKNELKSIAKICKENNTLVLSDEIYSRLHHKKDHVSVSKYYPEGTIITSGLSKWCGAGGWRLGTMIIPDELDKVKQAIINVSSETFSCVSSPIQYASVAAYQDEKYINDYLFHSRRILKVIGDYCYQELKNAEIKLHKQDGGFYLFPDFSNHSSNLHSKGIRTSSQLCKQLLKDTGVALLPGSAFGRPENEFTARLAYVNFDGARALNLSKKSKSVDFSASELVQVLNPVKTGLKFLIDWLTKKN